MMRSGPMTGGVMAAAWRRGWPRLWRDRWRWLARRWGFALAGFGAGCLGVGGWHFQSLQAWRTSEGQVHDLQAQLRDLQAQQQAQLRIPMRPPAQFSAQAGTPRENRGPDPLAAQSSPAGPPPIMAFWPTTGTQAAVWPHLAQVLAQHGVRLLSLRPEPPSAAGPWPSQTVALRLQARFDDWVAAWAALNAPGPLWGLVRLRITPQDGGVAIDAVLRLWLSPAPKGASALAAAPLTVEWHAAEPAPPAVGAGQRAHAAGKPVFVASAASRGAASAPDPGLQPQAPGSTPSSAAQQPTAVPSEAPAAGPTIPTLSPDPTDWPLDQVRLAGVWQQAQDVQPILMAGPHWVLARVGQRIGPQGHVVHSIHAQEVHLRAAQGPARVIGLEKAKP